jgi:hypothetical protein
MLDPLDDEEEMVETTGFAFLFFNIELLEVVLVFEDEAFIK